MIIKLIKVRGVNYKEGREFHNLLVEEKKIKWSAKAGGVLLLIEINFNNHNLGRKTLSFHLVNVLWPELCRPLILISHFLRMVFFSSWLQHFYSQGVFD